MTDNDNGSAESFFEQLLDEAVGPFFVSAEDGSDIIVTTPAAEDIADLDTTTSLTDQLDILTGNDVADLILELYASSPVSDLAQLIDEIREHFGLLVAPSLGWAQLVDELDRYGAAIERELIDHRLDLYDWVRDHRNTPWNKLFRILAKPIEGGHYLAAISSDLDRAQKMLAMEDAGKLPKPSSRPSIIGWNSQRELLTETVETLRRIEHATYAASPKFKGRGGKAPKNFPRPRTARDVATELRSFRDHDEIGAQVLGDRYKPILA
ncbi:hypothetical protein EEB13_05545 [Rhodococcus sp. WS3]|uniref:hypothetical protein n=1 Tax=Rhodococcus sp. WS3 TaxID=2486271 RepID=UPI00114121DE|nr:hypothetical protein [Rhodococcus sp. WS3]ROZ49387.1 hypothetical protein EEB13_05545 [Rhodococcus sp. WS3]